MYYGKIISKNTTFSAGDSGECEENILVIQTNDNLIYQCLVNSVEFKEMSIGQEVYFRLYKDRIDYIKFI